LAILYYGYDKQLQNPLHNYYTLKSKAKALKPRISVTYSAKVELHQYVGQHRSTSDKVT